MFSDPPSSLACRRDRLWGGIGTFSWTRRALGEGSPAGGVLRGFGDVVHCPSLGRYYPRAGVLGEHPRHLWGVMASLREGASMDG